MSVIENLLHDRIGLDVLSIGRASLERAVTQRAGAAGVGTVEEYADVLGTTDGELQELIESTVVPETWFFRHPEAYLELAQFGAAWAAADRGLLRVLSVPCSTGEEPYSIAITLLDYGPPADRFAVDAVDISRRSIAAARAGVFGANSFRSDLAPSPRHLTCSPEGYRVSDDVQRHVTFMQGNLMAPDFRPGRDAYDVVFCRNLLIYFDKECQHRALRTLDGLLAPDGLLFVGPADAFAALTSGFEPAGRPGAFAFRRRQTTRKAQRGAALPRRASTPARPPIDAPAPPPRRHAESTPAGAGSGPAPAPAPSLLEAAKRLADAGQMPEAAAACRRHLETAGPSADAFYLLALITDALDDRPQALALYRKALYLDPGHAEALAQLALLTAARGDSEQAGVLASRARRAVRRDGGLR